MVPSATVSRLSRRAATSVMTDAIEGVRHLVALAGLVVPVELARLFRPGHLVRAVAVGLVLGQAAAAEPLLLAVDDVLRRLRQRALNDSGHWYSLRFRVRKPSCRRAIRKPRAAAPKAEKARRDYRACLARPCASRS